MHSSECRFTEATVLLSEEYTLRVTQEHRKCISVRRRRRVRRVKKPLLRNYHEMRLRCVKAVS